MQDSVTEGSHPESAQYVGGLQSRLDDLLERDMTYREAAATRAVRITELVNEAADLRSRLRRRERELSDLRKEVEQLRATRGPRSVRGLIFGPASIPRRLARWLGRHENNPVAQALLTAGRRSKALLRRSARGRAD